MKVHDLKPAPGSNTRKRRVGRGIGGKGGKTAGRGTKGQQAQAEVQGARLYAVPPVRTPAFGVPKVRSLPYLPSGDGARRRGSGRHEGELVR